MGTLCSDPVRVFYEEHSSNTVTGALSQEARQGGSNAPVKVLFPPCRDTGKHGETFFC